MTEKEHVFVALSGGVDSAVTAAKLLVEGYQVTGIYMSTWKDPQWDASQEDRLAPGILAQKVADALNIPIINLDVRDQFYETVVHTFINQYLAGLTPNPCLFCNPRVKWGLLQATALAEGADYFATGHYARIIRLPSGQVELWRGSDPTKDQSYVLSMLSQEKLSRTLLPLGGMTKMEVRALAHELNLPVAEQAESQDLCFIGKDGYHDFLERMAPEAASPGDIVDMDGKILGRHEGLAFYTIGQRKGIRLAATEPYYVIGKDQAQNRLIVGFIDRAGQNTLKADQTNWIAGEPPEQGEMYDVMIRYRAKPVKARLSVITENNFELEFTETVRGITPGQVAVLYLDDICLGGGFIQTAAG
jgi:tRNA-specific 2-thiouridylase